MARSSLWLEVAATLEKRMHDPRRAGPVAAPGCNPGGLAGIRWDWKIVKPCAAGIGA